MLQYFIRHELAYLQDVGHVLAFQWWHRWYGQNKINQMRPSGAYMRR